MQLYDIRLKDDALFINNISQVYYNYNLFKILKFHFLLCVHVRRGCFGIFL